MARWLVGDVMTKDVVSVHPETSFHDVVKALEERGVGAVPVVDSFDRVVGVVAEADLILKIDFAGAPTGPRMFEGRSKRIARRKAHGGTAADLMTAPAATTVAEASIAEAIRLGGDRLVHFQANENHRGFPGTGATDWVAVGRALHDTGYKGPVSLEPFRRNDDRFGVPFAQWRAPHEDESERLAASATFIKSHLTLTEYRR